VIAITLPLQLEFRVCLGVFGGIDCTPWLSIAKLGSSITEKVIELAEASRICKGVERARLRDASRGTHEGTPRNTRQCRAD
jgi:hypothetical protein